MVGGVYGLRGVESWIGGVWGVERLGMAGGWGVGEKPWPGRGRGKFWGFGAHFARDREQILYGILHLGVLKLQKFSPPAVQSFM